MEERHKRKITGNLDFLCRDVDYERLRPALLSHRLFPDRQVGCHAK